MSIAGLPDAANDADMHSWRMVGSGSGRGAPGRLRSVVEEAEEDAVKDVLSSLVVLSNTNSTPGGTADDDDDGSDDDGSDGGEEGGGADDAGGEPDFVDLADAVPETTAILSRTLGESCRRGELAKNRALLAAHWVDKELRKLVGLITAHGKVEGGARTITFGVLFDAAQEVMEAVAGTLKTAKKHNVVSFDAEVLFRGMSDAVVITLLKDTIEDSDENTYTYRQVRYTSKRLAKRPPGAKKTSGFGGASLQSANSKCHVCSKTVYAMEFMGASGKAFHKTCFRCKVCNGILRGDTYATVNDDFYCKTHYDECFRKAGGYDFDKGNSSSTNDATAEA